MAVSVWTTLSHSLCRDRYTVPYTHHTVESTHSLSIIYTMAAHPTEHRLSPLSPSTNDVHTCALRAQLARNRKTMAYAVGVDRYAVTREGTREPCARGSVSS